MVRAKFKVRSKTEFEQGTFSIEMFPVCGDSEENKKFFKWTPCGELKLQTVNPDAAKNLEPGKEYYIDITPV
jgi:hypothetical protein